ncbi:MAG: decaprenyl-phosphate phosphoribosyltransferase [Endomicrobiales bacterium]|nr:decaprenyl-phosphate phosphoribosyltransferase [Endomicrobiales bacterium]
MIDFTLNAFHAMRPKQWTKNLFIFAGILFSQNLFYADLLFLVIGSFIVFCLLSGSVYVLNDILDLQYDRKHPVKSKRPVASGKITVKKAWILFYSLAGASFFAAFLLGRPFFTVAAFYFVLQVLYSFVLKHIIILDIFTIAAGFVLRVIAGTVVIGVEISSWLLICTILISLFLALSKRRHELLTLDDAHGHRKVLEDYSTELLDQMISVVTASTLVSYTLYTISDETVEKFGTKNLILTIPFVLYGIFRYLYLIHKKELGGSPETVLINDMPLLINIILWAAAAGFILYR